MNFEKATIKVLKRLLENENKYTPRIELNKIRIGKNKLDKILNYCQHRQWVMGSHEKKEWVITQEGIGSIEILKKKIGRKNLTG